MNKGTGLFVILNDRKIQQGLVTMGVVLLAFSAIIFVILLALAGIVALYYNISSWMGSEVMAGNVAGIIIFVIGSYLVYVLTKRIKRWLNNPENLNSTLMQWYQVKTFFRKVGD